MENKITRRKIIQGLGSGLALAASSQVMGMPADGTQGAYYRRGFGNGPRADNP